MHYVERQNLDVGLKKARMTLLDMLLEEGLSPEPAFRLEKGEAGCFRDGNCTCFSVLPFCILLRPCETETVTE